MSLTETEKTWLQKHERLIVVVLSIVALVFAYHLWINHSADVAEAKAQAAQKALQDQQDQNKTLANLVQQAQAQNQAIANQMAVQNAQITSAIAQRAQATQAAQQADHVMPLPDLANHWQTLLNLQPGEIQNTPSGLGVSAGAARTTVEQLETIPALKQDSSDKQAIINNKDTQITSLGNVTNTLQNQVVGLNAEIQDEKKSCQTQITSLKAQARKSKGKWFLAGVVVGYVGRILTAGKP